MSTRTASALPLWVRSDCEEHGRLVRTYGAALNNSRKQRGRNAGRIVKLLICCLAVLGNSNRGAAQNRTIQDPVRLATFNTSLNRRTAGGLIDDLQEGTNRQPRRIAEIIQRVRPHVILLNEFDYDPQQKAVRLFQQKFLGIGQNGQQPLVFPYWFCGPVNTGLPSGLDLNADGKLQGPADAFGFGRFPGQYGMIVYSMFPIDRRRIRTFQKFLWKDMPQAMMPVDESAGKPYYSQAVLKAFRLSSKSHWDLPIIVSGKTLHLLASHPTPPVFDGPEDRNGRRNHDEIRLFADYIDPQRSGYIYDDQGRMGGLAAAQYFVIAGDLNADPHDGDSTDRAVKQLIDHPLINSTTIPVSEGGPQQSRRQAGANRQHQGNPAHDTSDFDDNRVGNLRLDYLLPSRSLKVINGGVYWPRVDSKATDLVDASDHRLVWIDIQP